MSQIRDKADLELFALLKLAGDQNDFEFHQTEDMTPSERLYCSIINDTSYDLEGVTANEALYFLRLVGHNFPE